MLLDDMLHGFVIVMGINADFVSPGQGVLKAFGENTLHLPVGCDAVDGAVGKCIGPFSILNIAIGRIVPQNECKYAPDDAFDFADEQLPFFNIAFQQRPLGIAIPPLMGIAGLYHILPGSGIYLFDGGQVAFLCRSDHRRLLLKS